MTTRKTTTQKTATKTTAKTTKTQEELQEVEAVQEEEAQKVEQKTTKTAKAPTKKVSVRQQSIEDLIPVRSGVYGRLIYVSKRTQARYEWMEHGTVEYIPLGELVTMKSTQPRFLKDAWLIIDDEETIEYLGLGDIYETIFEIGDLDSFFKKSYDEMKELLENMPRGYKNSLANKARELIESEELDSNRVIKLLEEKLDVDLKIFEK